MELIETRELTPGEKLNLRLVAEKLEPLDAAHADQVAAFQAVEVDLEFPNEKLRDTTGGTMRTVRLRPPTAADLKRMSASSPSRDVGVAQMSSFLGHLSGLTEGQVDLLVAPDFQYLLGVAQAFLLRGRRTGGASS